MNKIKNTCLIIILSFLFLACENLNNYNPPPQCQGTTQKGEQCNRIVKNSTYCWQHK